MAKNIPINVKYMDSAGKAHDTEIERDAQNLRGSSLSVLETIAPSETVLDPIPEEDDNQWVAHLAQYEEIETGIKTGDPVWTFCGKLLYARKSWAVAICRACKEARPADYRYDPDFWSRVG